MTDDYEILDPTKTNSKFGADADTAPPSTPIMSSIKQPVISNTNQLTAVGDNKKESQSIEQKDKTILGKKDVEVQLEQRKRNTKDDGKMIDKHFNDKKLLKKINKELPDKEQGQKSGGDQFEEVYEYENPASSMRRAFLIATASAFLICIFHSLLGIVYLGCNKQLNFKFD